MSCVYHRRAGARVVLLGPALNRRVSHHTRSIRERRIIIIGLVIAHFCFVF